MGGRRKDRELPLGTGMLKMIDGALDGKDIKEDAEEENQERSIWRTKNLED